MSEGLASWMPGFKNELDEPSFEIIFTRYKDKICLFEFSNPEVHAFRSSEVRFQVRKFKANFVAKFGNLSANFGTSQLNSEKFGESYVKLTVTE